MHVHVERLALSECAYTERLALACMCMQSDWRWKLMYACAEQSAWRWHACAYTERLALNTFVPADYKRSRWNVAADLTFVLSQPRLAIWKAS